MIDKINNSLVNDKIKSVYNYNDYSIQDLLSKFFEKVNECIDTSNLSLNFLEWLKDEGIEKEVVNEIEKMYVDGRLTEIINTLSNNVKNQVNELNKKVDLEVKEMGISLNQFTSKYDNTNEDLKNKIDNINVELDKKLEKNVINQVTEEMLSQSLKEKLIEGGSIPIVGNNSVDLSQFSTRIQNDIGEWKQEQFTLIEGSGFEPATGKPSSSLDSRTVSFELSATSGDRFRLSGFTFGGETNMIMFIDSSDTLISKVGTDMAWGTPINYEFTCPPKTTKIRMNSWTNNSVKKVEKITYLPIATKKEIEENYNNLNLNKLEKINSVDFPQLSQNIQKDIGEYVRVVVSPKEYGYSISSKNIATLYTNGGTGNSHFIVNVKEGEIYNLTVDVPQNSSVYGIIITDDNLNVIKSDLKGNQNSIVRYENQEIIIPKNSTKLIVSFRVGSLYVANLDKLSYTPIATKKEVFRNEVPEFYREHLNQKIKRVQQLEMEYGGNGCTFALITDIHINNNHKYSPTLIKEIMENTNCKFLINNGDSAFYSTSVQNTKDLCVNELNEVRKLFNNATKNNFYSVKGNHDDNSTGNILQGYELLTNKELYSLLIGNNNTKIITDSDNINGLYYYFDDKFHKIRHIIIDSFESGQGEGVISSNQMKWLCEKALNFENEGWNICLYTHKPISPFETSDFSEVRDILNAIRYNTSFTKVYTDRLNVSYNIDVDFTNKNHNILFVMGGHNHIDYLRQDNNITYFKSVCDAKYKDALEISNRDGINSQSFDIVCINKDKKQINLVRVGCGSDERIFTYGDNASIIKNVNMTKKSS